MCLAVPVLVTQLHDDAMASVSAGGVEKRISVALLDEVAVGDYVLLHVGYALHRLSEADALETLALMADAGVLDETYAELAGESAA